MTIALTGATGQLGALVLEKLKARVAPDRIVALVRTPEKLAGSGVTARAFDYAVPVSLAPALDGVDTLLLISSSEVGQRTEQHRNVIAAAKQAGVGHIVYTSLLHADTSPLTGLAEEHLATEAALTESGIPFTLLRNGWYSENYASAIGGAVAAGGFIGAAGDGRISVATRDDYAEAAAAVLTGEGHAGATYELAGDEAMTMAGLAAEVSRQTGKTLPYRNMSEADYAAALLGFGLPEPVAQMLAGADAGAAQDGLFDDSHTLSRLIGRPTTPLSETVARILG
ncbi:SDR family oxidoreductase [Sphingomonas hengshuiensis]|uniref:NmrA family transcriptional regulator n=1 Tax=Sphingomonas hengshuiensis TaxID=1609977 RepID=A0A7U5BEY6_9SPHN|nr:SDR family oxidoreductase [Sphingomonas hengshuiensis]AJP70950.1 NmrA family transcriptional regulator [Sphingomonas hengshuiensis]